MQKWCYCFSIQVQCLDSWFVLSFCYFGILWNAVFFYFNSSELFNPDPSFASKWCNIVSRYNTCTFFQYCHCFCLSLLFLVCLFLSLFVCMDSHLCAFGPMYSHFMHLLPSIYVLQHFGFCDYYLLYAKNTHKRGFINTILGLKVSHFKDPEMKISR